MRMDALEGGFADAPREAAFAFRAAMTAMACPGRIHRLRGALPPAPMSPAAGTILLTLADADTPVHLSGAHDAPEIKRWLAFHTGASLAEPSRAVFAVGTWDALMPLDGYPVGTPEYPDRSATLIVERGALISEGSRLTGSGIEGSCALNLPDPAAHHANNMRFPLGVDIFFTCGDRIAALPRSTRIG